MKISLEETKDVRSRIKQAQTKVLVVEKILNSFSESSYIIKLPCVIGLLEFTGEEKLEDSLKSVQATLMMRNKNNLELMLNLLELTSMNQVDYEELSQYYMNHRGSEPILRFLLPKLPV